MKSKYFSNSIVVFLIISLFIFGCAKKEDQGQVDSKPVKVALVVWPGFGPLYLAQEKGYYQEEGINVELIIMENMEARRAALLSGNVDLEGITLESVVLANAKGVPMTVVAVSDISNGADGIIAKSEINTIQDLKGKKVAYPEAGPSHFFLLYELDKAGMSPDDIVPRPTDDAGQAGSIFAAGQVDAAVTWEPWISKARGEIPNARVIVDSKGVTDLLLGILAANRDFLPERREAIKKMLKGWYRAVEYWKQHPDKSNEIMAKAFEMPLEEFVDILSGARLADLTYVKNFFGTEENPGQVYRLVKVANDLWVKAGVMEKPLEDYKKTVDVTLINEIDLEKSVASTQ